MENTREYRSKEKVRLLGSKSTSQPSRNKNVDGVLFLVGGQGYILAENNILLQASHIVGEDLAIKAKKITLEAIIGSQYAGLKVIKKDAKLVLTFGEGEASVGAEMRMSRLHQEQYVEHANISSLIAMNLLQINTDSLRQHGGLIKANIGKVKAKEWIAQEVALIEHYNSSFYQLSLGVKIGARENVSGLINSGRNTTKSIADANSNNPFSAINIASNLYSTFMSATSLLSGGVVSSATGFYANANFSHYEKHRIHFEANKAIFNELYADIDGDISGSLIIESNKQTINARSINLYFSEDIETSSGYGANLSVHSSGSYSADGYISENGKTFGLGYSGNINSQNNNMFGDKLTVIYQAGKNALNASYARMDVDKVAKIYSGNIFNGNLVKNAFSSNTASIKIFLMKN